MSLSLNDSFRYCQQLARRQGRNFYFSFLTLPRSMFRDMCVLYTFMRLTDDIGDDTTIDVARRQVNLTQWRERVVSIFHTNAPKTEPPSPLELPTSNGVDCATLPNLAAHSKSATGQQLSPALGESTNVFPALTDVVYRNQIPVQLLLDVIEGVESDLSPRLMASFGELNQYCYHVAGAVGLCCLHVWGYDGAEAKDRAIDCGTAFQLTNILRDLREDAQMGRVYLPADELERFDYTRDELATGPLDDRFRELMAFQVERAQHYYDRGRHLFRNLHRPGRTILSAMFRIYGGLLQEIRRQNYDVYSRRIRLTTTRKLGIAVGSLILPFRK
ncbi:MAG: phytoene/squalene synthase family protein [Planctomycetaceae bacterium]